MALNNHVDHVLKDLVQIVACSLDFVFLRKQVFFHLTNRKLRRFFLQMIKKHIQEQEMISGTPPDQS